MTDKTVTTAIPDFCIFTLIHVAGRDLCDLGRWGEILLHRCNVARLLEDGDVIVDVGDNHGDSAAPYQSVLI